MLFINNLILFIISTISSLIIIYFMMPILKKIALDSPNNRSSHLKPVPSSGGISFFIVGLISFIFFKEWIFLLTIPIAIIGFLDDCIDIKPSYRLGVQLFTPISLLLIDDKILSFFYSSNMLIYLFLTIFLIIICVGIINFINFMDGLDGLVCGCMVVILIAVYFKYDYEFIPLIGALIGFLIFNWSPAKIFMGDIGSTFLGSIYVYLLLQSDGILGFCELFALGTPLFFDAIFCIIRRYLTNQNIFAAHRSHLYQRLNKSGLSHQTVSKIYIGATIILSIFFLADYKTLLFISSFFTLIVGYLLDVKIAISFNDSLKLN